jgi:hypothetical protein
MNETDLEREFLRNDMLAKEVEWLEQEHFYEEERNRRLPAIIKVVIPKYHKHEKQNSRKNTERNPTRTN